MKEFLWNGQRLDWLLPDGTVEENLAIWAQVHPELTTAVATLIEEPNGAEVYSLAKPEPKPVAVPAKPTRSGKQTYQVETSQGKRG